MSEASAGRKTFILGAGFSSAAGFPLVSSLRASVINFIETYPDPSWSADLTPGAKGFQFGQFYEGLRTADPGGTLGFEELLIQLDKFYLQSFHPANRTRTILEAACARVFWQIQNLLPVVPSCYQNFAAWLYPPSTPKHNVVSFNWDLVVERALEGQGFNWFYSRITNNSVAVLKPHGSINLSNHRGQGVSSSSDEWAQAVVGGTVDCLRDEIFRDPFEGGINEQFRFMVLPGHREIGVAQDAAEPIWNLAQEAIASSQTVVFIGYSLPVYDAAAAALLKDYCRGKKVEVYNPSPTDLRRFKDLFDSNVRLERQKFEECIYGTPQP